MEKLAIEDVANPEEISLLAHLECPIDNSVCTTPVMCKKCETVFCPDCIDNWKKKSNTCPMRCTPIELIQTDKTIVHQQLKKIKKWCIYQENGCLEKILLGDFVKHEKVCDYRPLKCTKCQQSVSMKFITNHLYEDCQKNRGSCFICEKELNLKGYLSHLEKCLESLDICKNCSQIKQENHICHFKLKSCDGCKLNDNEIDLMNKVHKCLPDHQNLGNVNTYLNTIYTKYEKFIQTLALNKENCYKNWAAQIKEISLDLISRESDKSSILDSKISILSSEGNKKLNRLKNERTEKINKLKTEIEELVGLIQCTNYI